MFAPGPGIDLIPIIISIPASLILVLFVEKYLTTCFAENVIKLNKYPFNNYIVPFTFNILAIIFSILSIPVFHEYMSLTVDIPLIHIKLNDFLTGTVIFISWVFPRFIYFSKSSKTVYKREYIKIFSAVIFNTLLAFLTFALCVLAVGNLYRVLHS